MVYRSAGKLITIHGHCRRENLVDTIVRRSAHQGTAEGFRQTDNSRNLLSPPHLSFPRRGDRPQLWFYHVQTTLGWSWWWNVPVTVLAVILIGAGQHQLTGLSHEAAHHILFKNRLINDLASDLLCMFPLFSAHPAYRLQHLAHHQFVNDPDRDPDISQLKTSGHWLLFPSPPAVPADAGQAALGAEPVSLHDHSGSLQRHAKR